MTTSSEVMTCYAVAMPSRGRRLALLGIMSLVGLFAAYWFPYAGSFWAMGGLAFWAGIATLWSP